MYWIKGCAKCNGDLYEGVDRYGEFVACMQCGHYLSEIEEANVRHSQSFGPTFRFKGPHQSDQEVVRTRVARETEPVAA